MGDLLNLAQYRERKFTKMAKSSYILTLPEGAVVYGVTMDFNTADFLIATSIGVYRWSGLGEVATLDKWLIADYKDGKVTVRSRNLK